MTRMFTTWNSRLEATLPLYSASESVVETPPPYPALPNQTFAGSSQYVELQELRRTELDRKTQHSVNPQPARDVEAQRPAPAAGLVAVVAANVQEQRPSSLTLTTFAFMFAMLSSMELVSHEVVYFLKKPAAEVCEDGYPKDSGQFVGFSFLIWILTWILVPVCLVAGPRIRAFGLPQGREREAAGSKGGVAVLLWGLALVLL